MKTISDFTILEDINKSSTSTIYRAKRDGDDSTYIIKLLAGTSQSKTRIARFKQEYEAIRSLDSDDIVKIFNIIAFNDTIALVTEDFEGEPLSKIIKRESLSVNNFLSIAIKLARALGNIHSQNIIHGNINPRNILINSERDIVKMTDFGIGFALTRKNENIYNREVIDGVLPYISPEQTGRMNRAIDYRTDMYSLGITFYEMLSGHLPFISSDPIEIIHSHIARRPVPLCELNPEIHVIISEIVMKLLSKAPEERYQNGFGLAADFEEYIKQKEIGGINKSFTLGWKDIPIKFTIPQRLFGRDNEIKTLMEAFEKTSRGSREAVFVSGDAGIGKSALINEIQKPVVEKRGYFISGKYEELRRDVPYSSIVHAFQQLIKQLLAQENRSVHEWKNRILDKTGTHAKLLIELIPELELITGPQAEVPLLGPEESEKRLHNVFKNFVKIFASEEHPLVLFLDDLQWADIAGLKLLGALLIDPEITHLLFIGAYRYKEVGSAHMLETMMKDIEQAGIKIDKTFLSPLDVPDVTDFIANFLKCESEKALPLSGLIHKKTNGNPFFINQFMKTLYEEKLLTLNPESGWEWDIDKINNIRVTDNVVLLMAEKIGRLKEGVQNALKTGACIGSRFDPEAVSLLSGSPIETVLSHMTEAVNEGLISESGEYYEFYHDRIQEAAYSLIPLDKRPYLHFKIGKLFYKNSEEGDVFGKIFYIVNHLNEGRKLITDRRELNELIHLNLMAGIRARNTAAYEQMFKYMEIAVSLLEENAWISNYNLALSVYTRAVEATYTATHFEEMERLADIVLENAKDLLDKAKIYEIKIQAYLSMNNLKKSLTTGLKALKLFGIQFPKKPSQFHVLIAFLKTRRILTGRKIENLIDLPPMSDPAKSAIIRIMSKVSSAAYLAMPELLPLIIFKSVTLSIKYGNAGGASAYFYSFYGIILCGVTGDIETGYRFGKLALNLLDKVDDKEFRSKAIFIFNSYIRPWKEHWRNSYKPFMDGSQSGLEYGDIEFAAHNAQMLSTFINFSSPDSINKEINEIIPYHNRIAQLKQKSSLVFTSQTLQLLQNFSDHSKNPLQLNGDYYNEIISLPQIIQENDKTAICSFYWGKTMLNFSFYNFEEAAKYADKSEKYLDAMISNPCVPLIYFYNALSRLAYYPDAPKAKQWEMLKKIKRHQKMMKKWAKHAPMNYLHKYQLVEAELARVKKQLERASMLYEKAIQGAQENEYIQEEAIAYECAGKFYLKTGFKDFAAAYITKSYLCYRKWGATVKLKHMEKKYPGIIFSVLDSEEGSSGDSDNASLKAAEKLDLLTVLKASRAIAGEIDLARLLSTIMRMAIENAGAERGFLIFENSSDGKLYIEAECSVNDSEIRVQHSVPVEGGEKLASSVVNYVHKTREVLVLHNASRDGTFVNDPYIKKTMAKSIFCAPIMRYKKLVTIMYLENNLAAGAFTASRLELLRLLASQAAISIENASLIIRDKDKAVMEKEIEMARAIQEDLLPSNIPALEKAVVAYKYVPAMGIGGDFINIRYFKEQNSLGLFIADVSGHGVSAALTASMVSMSLFFLWDRYIDNPSELFKEIRNSLKGKMGNNFLTAYVCTLNLDTGILTYARAGHPFLMFLRKDGSVEMIKPEGRFINNSFPLNCKNHKLQLNNGDKIILYTDGLSEAFNGAGEMLCLGDEKEFSLWLKERMIKAGSPSSICNMIYDDVIEYSQSKNLVDDFAMIAMEYRG